VCSHARRRRVGTLWAFGFLLGWAVSHTSDTYQVTYSMFPTYRWRVSGLLLICFFTDTPSVRIPRVSKPYPYRIRIRYRIRAYLGVSGYCRCTHIPTATNTTHCINWPTKLSSMKDGDQSSNQPCIRPRTAPLASPPTTEFVGSLGVVARASLASSRAPV
jgi:hypothetical protein